jgi:hypothetical protein
VHKGASSVSVKKFLISVSFFTFIIESQLNVAYSAAFPNKWQNIKSDVKKVDLRDEKAPILGF